MDRGGIKYGMGSYTEFVATFICLVHLLFVFSIPKKIFTMEKNSIHKIKIFLM